MARTRRIVLTGGGTAGHINPLLAVAAELEVISAKNSVPLEIVFMGSAPKYEKNFIDDGLKVFSIVGSKLRRYADIDNFLEIPKFAIGFIQALWHLFWIMPDIVFSKGGHGSLSVILAARLYRITVVIHESDSVPSMTTKISSRFAKKIFLSFESSKEYFNDKEKSKCEVYGNPIRRSLIQDLLSEEKAKGFLGFDTHKPLILVLGGSQGSQRINKLILASLPDLLSRGIQILHQTGEKLFGEVEGLLGHFFKDEKEMRDLGYHPIDFIEGEMKDVMQATDLIISRAGGSIFEFAALGKPSILIPLPESASNHQYYNAKIYNEAGACLVLQENEISTQIFSKTVLDLVNNPVELENMGKKAKEFSKPEAASNIAQKLIELTND